jgi:hypothetical protein
VKAMLMDAVAEWLAPLQRPLVDRLERRRP